MWEEGFCFCILKYCLFLYLGIFMISYLGFLFSFIDLVVVFLMGKYVLVLGIVVLIRVKGKEVCLIL